MVAAVAAIVVCILAVGVPLFLIIVPAGVYVGEFAIESPPRMAQIRASLHSLIS